MSRGYVCTTRAGLCVALAVLAFVSLASAQGSAEPKGKLTIEGTHIARLTLERDDGHVEEWKNLSGTIEIPVGTYRVQQLALQADYACKPDSRAALGPIEVCQSEAAVLKAGGPLEQSIATERRGGLLVLTYHLRGIGGEAYEPASAGRARFTIYSGDTAVIDDAFTYS